MIKSNKNMLKMLVALAFTMSPVFAVAACNSSTKDDQAKLKTGDLNKLKIIAPEIEAFNNVKDKTAVTKEEITTVVNTIVKTGIDQIVTKTVLNVDYRIQIKKDTKIITSHYNLTSKNALDRTFDITVIKTQTAKLKGIHKSQSIIFPELKGAEEVVTKADLSKLEAIESAITIDATESTNTSADMIIDAVKEEVLKLVNKLANGKDVAATDLDITVKKDDVKLTSDSIDLIDLKDSLTLNVEVKASKGGEAKLEGGEKTITVKIAKITPVVVKADLSKLEAIESAITIDATESTNTSADMIIDAVKEEVLKLVNKLANGKDVAATDLDITVKKDDVKLTSDSIDLIDLKDSLTLNVEVKASKGGEAKLEGGEKTITVKIAKITPVVVKADLSKLEAIESAITIDATESTNTSADMIIDAVKEEVLKLVNKLANGKDVAATDLDITVKKDDVKLTSDSIDLIDLKDSLTLNVEVKASKGGEAKLEGGEKTITVKIAKITPVVVKADLSKLEAIESAITIDATESTNTSADMIIDAVKEEVLKLVNKLANGKDVAATDLDITVKKDDVKLTSDSIDLIDLKDSLTLNVEVKASKGGEAKLEGGEKTITVKIAKITPVVVKADLSKLEAIESAITIDATESTNTSADMIIDAVKEEVLKLVNKLANGKDVAATDLDITVKKDDVKLTSDSIDLIDLKDSLTLNVEVKASKGGEAKLEGGEKTITVKIAKITPVVVKADLSKLEAIESAITIDATESTNTSADMIIDAVKEEVLKLVNKLANGKDVAATDLDITVKKDDVKLTSDSIDLIDLKDSLTLNVEVKASKGGEAKLEGGEKTITVKIAKITPVVVKADLSKLEAIESAITIDATESTNTSADMIIDPVKEEVLKLVNKLANGKDVAATDLDITVKKDDVKLTSDSIDLIDLKDGLTLNVEVKASKGGEAKLEGGEKTITVKIAKINLIY